MLTKAGCQDVNVDFKTKKATLKVPAAVTDEDITKAVGGQFSAKIQN